MELGKNEELNASSRTLDHLGLVSATFKDLGLMEKIDAILPSKDPRRIVEPKHAILAMILNGLGFSQRTLYMVPRFFENKPIDRLIGPGITAKNLDDHALGEALDEIYAYGTTEFFATLAVQIGLENNFFGKTAHLDTTSISVYGDYAGQDPESSAISITHGFSKDHRQDLKQMMCALCTTGAGDFPFWFEAQSGNSSDKKTFPEIIERARAFLANMRDCPDLLWISDSALYTKNGLLSKTGIQWTSRVPETIKEAKDIIRMHDASISWSSNGERDVRGYKNAEFHSSYGGVKQRWILIDSKQAYEREKKTFEKNLQKKSEALKKALWHFSHQVFGCDADAKKAFEKIQKSYPLHQLEFIVEPIMKNESRGRPKKDAQQVQAGCRAIVQSKVNAEAVQKKLNTKGRFILATNSTDSSLTSERILEAYKEQQGVERGFRFMKDPQMMVSSVFLKSPKRIEALMAIMALTLLVYNAAQHHFRKKLIEAHESIPSQLEKPTQKPTLRWVFQTMEGIHEVVLHIHAMVHCAMTGLSDLRRKIIRLFGPTAMKIYQIA